MVGTGIGKRFRAAFKAYDVRPRHDVLDHADAALQQCGNVLHHDDVDDLVRRAANRVQQDAALHVEAGRQPVDHIDVRQPRAELPHGYGTAGDLHLLRELLLGEAFF